MSYPQGIDFRGTLGFVTDPANCSMENSAGISYPRVTAQGNTVGWEDAVNNSVDRSAYAGDAAKVSGIAFGNNGGGHTTARYRFDLPSTGNYKFRVGAGDAGGINDVKVELFDTTTSLAVLVGTHTTSGADRFYDATDIQRTSHTDWSTNQALSASMSFATTICRLKMGPEGPNSWVISHLWAESAGGPAPILMGQASL